MVSAVLAKEWEQKKRLSECAIQSILIFILKKNISCFSPIVNPELLAARYIANIIEFPNALSVERFANGRVSLMEFKVKQNSDLCQMTMSQFHKNLAMS